MFTAKAATGTTKSQFASWKNIASMPVGAWQGEPGITAPWPSPSSAGPVRAAKQNPLHPELAELEAVPVHLLPCTHCLYFWLHLMSSELAAKSGGDGGVDHFLAQQLRWQCRLMFQDN